jgi:hypothetical protein
MKPATRDSKWESAGKKQKRISTFVAQGGSVKIAEQNFETERLSL